MSQYILTVNTQSSYAFLILGGGWCANTDILTVNTQSCNRFLILRGWGVAIHTYNEYAVMNRFLILRGWGLGGSNTYLVNT